MISDPSMVEQAPFDFLVLLQYLIGILALGLAYKFGKFFILAKSESKPALKMQIQELKEVADHHRAEAQRWRGRYGHTQKMPTIQGNPEDPESVIPGLIDQFSEQFPFLKKIGILKDPATIKFLIQQAKDHPDAAKSIISNFIAKPGKSEAEQQTDVIQDAA